MCRWEIYIHVHVCTLLSMNYYYSYMQHKPNDEAVQMPVHMCTPNLKMTSADKPDVEEQHYPIEPGLL